jgi:hypothetical protein
VRAVCGTKNTAKTLQKRAFLSSLLLVCCVVVGYYYWLEQYCIERIEHLVAILAIFYSRGVLVASSI